MTTPSRDPQPTTDIALPTVDGRRADATSGDPIDAGPRPGVDAPLAERVAVILERIRPGIQMDGGDLELVSVDDDGVVTVRLHGACVGCPSSSITLQAGIERQLRDHVPEIRRVDAIE